VSDTTKVSCDRSRSWRHIGSTLAVALLAAAMLIAGTSHDGRSPSIGDARAIAAESAAQQAGQCVQAVNSAHVTAGRATQLLLWTWARGSNNYLGLLWDTTSLREGPTGTWTLVANCDASPAASEWPTVGLNLNNTRAVLDEETITPDNVQTLGRAWQVRDIEGVTGTPIVDNGTLYVGDWTGHIRALNPTTGQQLWAQDVGSQIPGAVAVDDARVFAGTWDGRLVARNRQTGAALWEQSVDDHEVAVIYGSPVYADGKVIVPVASDEWYDDAEFTFRGSVVAYDAATGNEVWRYWTTCGPENAGQNNCPAGANEGPGVGVWSYPTVDLERNMVFFGTGNHYSPPTTGRSDALIAVDLDTGQERWVHQFTEGDWWNLPSIPDPDVGPDYDVMQPSLVDAGDVPAVAVGDKGGTFKAVNRETGEEIWSQKLTNGSIQGGIMASATVVPAERVNWTSDVIYFTSNRGGQNADLIVVDASNGMVLWRVDVGGSVVSPVTWANGLIYVTDNSGHITAFDGTDLLKKVWTWDYGFSSAGGVTIVDGMVYAGWGWALSGESPNGGLMAFELGGDPPDEEPPPEPDGEAIYQQNCAACHGVDGSGGNGPDLRGIGQAHSIEEITEVVTNGRGAMPAWEGVLTPEEIAAVVEYIAALEGGDPHSHHGGGHHGAH
jgi:polyvinyl alcohol dehydrogenase (cytochrome)